MAGQQEYNAFQSQIMIRTCEVEEELMCRQSQQLLGERWVAMEDWSEVAGGSLRADLR